jgi:type I restriction enzyme S subunit
MHIIFLKKSKVQADDIIINKIANAGATYLMPDLNRPVSLAMNLFLLRVKKEHSARYLFSQIKAKEHLLRALASGTGTKTITKLDVRNFKLDIPSFPEQQKIASFLSSVDEKIQQLSRKKELLSQYKKGVMQQLFSGKLRFKDENGKDYADWEEKRLGDMLKINATYGVVTAGEFQQQGIKMIRGGDIKKGLVSSDSPFISKEKALEYKRTELLANDIVISLVGYPGEAAVIPINLIGHNISRAVGLLRLKNKTNPQFVVQYLNSPIGRKIVLKPSAGSAQQVVNLKDLNNLITPYPSIQEQQKIADFLSSIDTKIESTSQQINQTQSFKKGLLQQLFV